MYVENRKTLKRVLGTGRPFNIYSIHSCFLLEVHGGGAGAGAG